MQDFALFCPQKESSFFQLFSQSYGNDRHFAHLIEPLIGLLALLVGKLWPKNHKLIS